MLGFRPWMWVWGGVLCGLLAVAWPYTVDDAYIVARYATHLAHGLGYTMNVGQPASDGVTGPLWLAPGVMAAAFGLSPVAAAKVVGAVSVLLSGFLCLARLRRQQLGRVSAAVAASLWLAQPTLVTWSVAGLSSGLAALVLVLSLPGPGGSPRALSAYGAALMPWLRPELVPVALVLALLPPLLARRPAPGVVRRAWLLPLGSLVLLVALRTKLFGDVLPLSVRAKPAEFGHGVAYLARALALTTGIVGLWPAWLGAQRGGRRERIVAVAFGVGLLSIALAGGDWMPGFRLMCPLVPLYIWLVARGVTRLALQRSRAVVAVVCGFVLLAPLSDWAVRAPALHAVRDSQRGAGETLARLLRTRGGPVALVDVGFLGFRSEVPVFDLGGVTEPRVAHLPGGHLDKRIPEALLRTLDPPLIVLHSRTQPRLDRDGRLLSLSGYAVEQRVARMAWVQQRYRVAHTLRYAPGYFYTLLERR